MEDSKTNQDEMSAPEAPKQNDTVGLRRSVRHDALLPISIVGGLLGMLAGTLPAAVWVLIFRKSFAPLYVFLPLLIFLGIRVFKGCMGRRGFAVTCVLSVIGFYLTALSCQAALDVLKFKVPAFNLPLVTITMIGRTGTFSGPFFSPQYIFPILFTILGVTLVYELMRRQSAKD